MKKKTIYIIIGAVLGVVLLIFLLSRIPKREFNEFDFPNSLVVENYTDNDHADTVSMVILNKLLDYDLLEVSIYPMPAIFLESKEIEYVAFLMKDPFDDHVYMVFLLEDCGLNKMKMALCHEYIHLHQFETGKLETLEEYGYVWEGDTTKYSDVEYKYRPHEREAVTYGRLLEQKLNAILYKPRK